MAAATEGSVSVTEHAQDIFETLIRDAQSGDQTAFSRLYELFRPRVAKFLFNASGDYCLADELTNDTFLRAHGALGDLRQLKESSFLSFLFSIAANLLCDHHRRKELPSATMEEDYWNDVPARTDPSGQAVEHIEGQERSQMLRQALAELPPEQSSLISLSHFDELTAEQIAQILGKPSAQAVRAALHRAMKHLQKVLVAQGYFETVAA